MKRIWVGIGVMLVCAMANGQTEGVRISRLGVNGSYSAGGDIEESKPGFGLQTELAFNANVSIELAASSFSDEWDEDEGSMDQDLTTIGLSAVYRMPIGSGLQGYALGGVDYNIVDMDASLNPEVFGGDIDASVDIEDEVGFHIALGVDLAVHKNWELFAEYRYTFLELEGDISVSGMGVTVSETIEGDYDFGLIKLGVNYLF